MQQRRSQRGFTLIELMVVIAIIAILSTLLFSMSSRTYGANAYNVSNKISSTMNWVKMRAVSTRRNQYVQITPQALYITQSDITGFAESTSSTNHQVVESVAIPNGVSIWQVDGVAHATTGNTVTQNTSLNYTYIEFKPDGSSSGATIYVVDSDAREYRVLVYKATGSSYARQTW
jgi:prepilin-type N-terminal cleavage/methylation domain-containing protein